MELKTEKLYAPKEVSERLGITPDLLRKWVEEFNVITEWTQANGRGHRRFTKENMELLTAIRKKIQEQNWSWDQVRSWRNGEIDAFVGAEEKSNLEKNMDNLLLNQEEFSNNQMKFNQALLQKLDTLASELMDTKHKLIKMEKENEELKSHIDNRLQMRDQLLLESIRETQQEKKEKGFFSRIFK